MKRHNGVGFLAALLMASPSGSPWPSVAQQPIQIGASMSITGRYALRGGYQREGYLLCQKHVNERGGVLGRTVEFLIRDDRSDGQTTVSLYEKLITEDKVDAVMGPYSLP
jgi:branched-chain amino acid transport system substrate-binding protein